MASRESPLCLQWRFPESIKINRINWIRGILRDNHGLDFQIEPSPETEHRLFVRGHKGEIRIRNEPCPNLSGQVVQWWQTNHLNTKVPLIEKRMPVIRGKMLNNGDWIDWENGKSVTLGVDIMGTIFSILSREEEIQIGKRDSFQRFPAKFSLAFRNGFLDRPIIDEYVEILWSLIKDIWPFIPREWKAGNVLYSCDVDTPFDPAAYSSGEFLKRLSADLIKRHSPGLALRRFRNAGRIHKGDFSNDKNNTFNFILQSLGNESLKGRFHFISSAKSGKGHGWYRIEMPFIKDLLRTLNDAGHSIGLHGSFGSYKSLRQIENELEHLKVVLESIGIREPVEYNRQHFLQWDPAITPDILDNAGIRFDSSGGFAECPGFRFGTAHSFPMWSWKKLKALNLVQIPLILMDCSLVDPKYMGLRHFPEGLDHALMIKERALRFGGNFSLLWHNSYLDRPEDRDLFISLLAK